MAKGPERHFGSIARNTAAATALDIKTLAARTCQDDATTATAEIASPSVAAITAATELIAMASQAVLPQRAGPMLTPNAIATLAAAHRP